MGIIMLGMLVLGEIMMRLLLLVQLMLIILLPGVTLGIRLLQIKICNYLSRSWVF